MRNKYPGEGPLSIFAVDSPHEESRPLNARGARGTPGYTTELKEAAREESSLRPRVKADLRPAQAQSAFTLRFADPI
jgi:hypothetical protein